MGLEPQTFSAGSPMNLSVPLMPCFSMAALAASASATARELLEYEAEDVLFPEVLVGKARAPSTSATAESTPVGQLLTMSRWVPSSTTGDGTLKALNITATVQRDRTFTLHFQLGLPGTYGYAVGYRTAGSAPENRSFQFQFTTTGSGKADPSIGSSTAPKLSAKTDGSK